jgi:hypothetical protein
MVRDRQSPVSGSSSPPHQLKGQEFAVTKERMGMEVNHLKKIQE